MDKVIININIEFDIPVDVKTQEKLDDFICNVELPHNYVENSFEFVKVIDGKTYQDKIYP